MNEDEDLELGGVEPLGDLGGQPMADLGELGDADGALGADEGLADLGDFGGGEAEVLSPAGDAEAQAAPSSDPLPPKGDFTKGAPTDRRRKAVLGVPIEVVVTVGRARPLLSELVGLKRDSVLPLDSKLADPVEIVIGDRIVARGELQELDGTTGRLGVRLTEVADLSQTL